MDDAPRAPDAGGQAAVSLPSACCQAWCAMVSSHENLRLTPHPIENRLAGGDCRLGFGGGPNWLRLC